MKRDDVIRLVKQHGGELAERYGVKSLALFGSVARNDATDISDVDLLVDFNRPITLFDLIDVRHYLEELLGVEKVDLVMRDCLFPELRDTILEDAIDVS